MSRAAVERLRTDLKKERKKSKLLKIVVGIKEQISQGTLFLQSLYT